MHYIYSKVRKPIIASKQSVRSSTISNDKHIYNRLMKKVKTIVGIDVL